MIELNYIEQVCCEQKEKLPDMLNGPFIGILGMLPSLKEKIDLLASQAYTLHNCGKGYDAKLGVGCTCKVCEIALSVLSPTEEE